MPPKAKACADVVPRRSARARAKRPADTEEQSLPTKQPRKGSNSKSQGLDGEDKSSSPANKPKRTTAATSEANDTNKDTSANASKTTKASKNAQGTKAATAGAKQTDEEPAGPSSLPNQAAQKPSASAAAADPACPRAHSTKVAGDADVMLNQSNISANNNKFYRMQLLQEGPSDHWLWTRWGRVGDKGQHQLQGPFDADTGLKEFNKKFKYAFS